MNTRKRWLLMAGCLLLGTQLLGVAQNFTPSHPLSTWSVVHPHDPLTQFGAVGYGNGRYVVVAADPGRPDIMVSTNAFDWVSVDSEYDFYYSDLLFAEGRFWLAGGEDDDPPAVILTSTNGENWTIAYENRDAFFRSLEYESGTWLAISAAEYKPPKRVVSTNGNDWIQIPFDPAVNLYCIAATRGRWLGVGYGGATYVSSNALDWTQADITHGDLRGIAGEEGMFLAYGSRVPTNNSGHSSKPFIAWSYAATNWTDAVLPEFPLQESWTVESIVYGSHGWLALLHSSTSTALLKSSDGIHWSWLSFLDGGPYGGQQYSLSYAGAYYFLTGMHGAIFLSVDGREWTQVIGASHRQIRTLTDGPGGGLVAVGEQGLMLTSTDGTTWVHQDKVTKEELFDIAVSHENFVVVGGDEHPLVLTSSNGLDWRSWSSPVGKPLRGVTCESNGVLGVGLQGTVLRIKDGDYSIYQVLPGRPDFRDVVFFRGKFIAVAYAGQYLDTQQTGSILTSADGVSWTTVLTHPSPLTSVAADASRVVVVNCLGQGFVSTTGEDWHQVTINSTYYPWLLTSVACGNGLFVAPGGQNKVFTSTDGTNWTARADLNPLIYYGTLSWVAYGGNCFFTGSGAERMLRSKPVWPTFHQPMFSGGNLMFPMEGIQPEVCVLQTSTDLRTWSNAGVITNTPGSAMPLPFNPQEPHRYYRVIK